MPGKSRSWGWRTSVNKRVNREVPSRHRLNEGEPLLSQLGLIDRVSVRVMRAKKVPRPAEGARRRWRWRAVPSRSDVSRLEEILD